MTVVQFSSEGAGRGKSPESSSIIAALDVGTTKICCVIAEALKPRRTVEHYSADLRILGVGHQASRGVRGGVVIDIDEAEKAIRLAVEIAERKAGVTIGAVYASVSGGRPRCQVYSGDTRVMANEVSAVDAQRAISVAARKIEPGNRVILHTSPVQFRIDEAHGVKKPLGMFGETLTVDLNAITVEPGAIRNLGRAIGNCHLDVRGYVIAPYAGARSVLVDDEMKLGVTYVELGGGTTGIASFFDGNLVFSDVVPLGGQHITNDIARGLSTTLAHAERLKTLSGSAVALLSDEREYVTVPQLGERGADAIQRVSRAVLTGIIGPRVEEILEHVRDRLDQSPLAKLCGNRVVLSGGTSMLVGLPDVAARILNRAVRTGSPRPVSAMTENVQVPAFAVATGLLRYAMKPDKLMGATAAIGEGRSDAGYLSRVGRWFRDSF